MGNREVENTKSLRLTTSVNSQKKKQIMRQIEFYLSEGNLNRDSFFREEMNRTGQQGINIALLLQCNRLIHLGATEELIKRAVCRSTTVHLSENGEMVVRCNPLGELCPKEKRTILVVGLPRWSHSRTASSEQLRECDDELTSDVNDQTSLTGKEPVHKSSFTTSEVDEVRWNVTDWLHQAFGVYGEVLYVNLPFYHNSGMLRGFAFVEFASSKSARAAARALAPTADSEFWFTSPSTTETCSENAWKPRLAARASFSEVDMLARRYVWRCCSRRNKQIVSIFRHLRHAGYRAPNPCDREYELITLGASTEEARRKYLAESYGEPTVERLSVLRYSVWTFWRTKFYLWLNAWISRMRQKTEELSINQFEIDQTDCQSSTNQSRTEMEDDGQTVPKSKEYELPKDFVPGTIIQVYWPVHLISNTSVTKPITSLEANQSTVVVAQPMSLPRRIRIGIESHVLSPAGLLKQVAHFDSNPSPGLPANLSSSTEDTTASGDSVRLFIRMRSATAAHQLVTFVNQQHSEGSSTLKSVTVKLLSEREEAIYCRAISESKMGAGERRRRIQAKRRERIKQHAKQSDTDEVTQRRSNDSRQGIVTLSANQCAERTTGSTKKAKHIFFESEDA